MEPRNRPSADATPLTGRRGNAVLAASEVRWECWVQRGVVLLIWWLVAFQPLSADDWWWHLSRGRAVWQGSWSPSATLLTLEERWEADWLGGLPAYLLYQSLGASGWMLCRLMLVGLLLFALVDSLRSQRVVALPALLLSTVTLIAVAGDLDPVPRLFDMLGILFVAWRCWPAFSQSRLAKSQAELRTGWRTGLAVGAIFWLWGATGPSVAVGGLLLFSAALCATLAGQKGALARWIEWTVAVFAGSLNPRGLFTWSDSLISLVPASVTSPAALEGTPWGVLHGTEWDVRAWTFLGLTLLWITNRWLLQRQSMRGRDQASTVGDASPPHPLLPVDRLRWFLLSLAELVPFAAVQWLAWSSARNVPLAIVWLAAEVTFQWRATGLWFKRGSGGSEDLADGQSGSRRKRRVSHYGRGRARGERDTVGKVLLRGIAAVALLGLLVKFSGLHSSLGWGIAGSLDYRLLLAALDGTAPHGTALADDTRSAGMLQWILPQLRDVDGRPQKPFRLQDVAYRAVTGGRWERHRLLFDDIRRGRLSRYWRDDGTPGGYWLELKERGTTLLCISNRRVELVRGLEPSLWKPLSLDSRVLPYAPAGDQAYMRRMIEVLQHREIIEYQPWQYQLPMSIGSPFDRDLFGLWPDTADADEVAAQGDVLRAMNLHYAALRVLFVGRGAFPSSERIEDVLQTCQSELAEEEYINAGQASWFRFWASRHGTGGRPLPAFAVPPQRGVILESGGEEPWDREDALAVELLRQRIEAYWREGPAALLQGSGDNLHPQIAYAMLCGAMEAGLYERADELIASLQEQSIQGPLAVLVQQRYRELHPAAAESAVGSAEARDGF